MQTMIRIGLSLLLSLMLIQSAAADKTSDSNRLFDWAERNFPHQFQPADQPSQTMGEWFYRHYPATNLYVGVNDADEVYLLASGEFFYINTLTHLLTLVNDLPATEEEVQPIRLVSTPNPSVLPLLLAMAQEPDLPIELIPVSGSSGIDDAFVNQNAEAVLSMTWVAAAKANSGVASDLRLLSVHFWRGFFELTHADASVNDFAELVGKNLLVSGPVGGGRNGGPDLLFLAALRRSGFDSSLFTENTVALDINGEVLEIVRRHFTEGDFRVYYLPVSAAAPAFIGQMLLDDGDGDSSNDQPASGAFMVEPAGTGISLNANMEEIDIARAISAQQVFSGYSSWDAEQLPLGGLSIRASVLDDAKRSAQIKRLRTAYEQAVTDLMAAKEEPMQLMQLATLISEGITEYYQQFGMDLPAAVITAAIRNEHLLYRNDLSVKAVLDDLTAFNREVLDAEAPEGFYVVE